LAWDRVLKATDFQPSDGMPSGLYREFQRWPGWVRTKGLPLGIRVSGQAALPWESDLVRGWLAAERLELQSPSELWPRVPFRPYRWQPFRSKDQPARDVRSARHVFFVSSPRREASLEEGWDREGLKPRNASDDWAQIEAHVEWPGEVRLVHFMGRPIETPTGLALKVESRAEFRGTMSKGGSVLGVSELLIVPGKQGLNRIPLLIVQGETSEIGELTATDWVEMGKLRGFCGRLFEDGAMAVLMIPPLPSALARSVVAELAAAVGKCRSFELKQLLGVTQAAREHIAAWGPEARANTPGASGASGGAWQRRDVSGPPAEASETDPRRYFHVREFAGEWDRKRPVQEGSGVGPTSDALLELSIAVTLFARHNFRHLPSDP
jgi:hypothetical protein